MSVVGLSIEGFEWLQWGDMWPRHIAYGECEGWCGSGLIVVITRMFTPDEDLLFDWVEKQDDCDLYGVQPLVDGRELMVFNRQFRTQTPLEAYEEHIEHLRSVLARRRIVSYR